MSVSYLHASNAKPDSVDCQTVLATEMYSGAVTTSTTVALDVVGPTAYAAVLPTAPTAASAPVSITPGANANRIYALVTVVCANWDTSYNSLGIADSTGDVFTQVGPGMFLGWSGMTEGSVHIFECQLTKPGVVHNLVASVKAPYAIVGIRIKPISVVGVASIGTLVTQMGGYNALNMSVPSGTGHLVLFNGGFPSSPVFSPSSAKLEISGPVTGGYAQYSLAAAAPGAATVNFTDTTAEMFGAVAVDLIPGTTVAPPPPPPPTTPPTTPPTSDGSTITLGELTTPSDGVLSGVVSANSGIVGGLPSTTGKVFAQWDSGVFNLQSQHWVPAPAAATDGSRSACQNVTTPRTYSSGPLANQPVGSYFDINFQSDSPHVSALYYYQNAYTGRLYHDVTWEVEDNGKLGQVSALPATSTGGLGWYTQTLTFADSRMRDHRIWLPGDAVFAGIYIDTPYQIAPTANKWLVALNGDSWNEAAGGVLASPLGGAYPTGTYETMNLPQALAMAWGCAVIPIAQFGTGRFIANNNAVSNHTTNVNGNTTFEGDLRISDYASKFSGSGALILTIGGWNDASYNGAPYHDTYMAECQRGIDAWKTAIPGVQLLYVGIQPGDITGVNDPRYLNNQGLKDACASRASNVAGFIDSMPMWYDLAVGWTGTSWPGFGAPATLRSNNVNNTDTLHLHAKGANMVSKWITDRAKHIPLQRTYIEAQRAAA